MGHRRLVLPLAMSLVRPSISASRHSARRPPWEIDSRRVDVHQCEISRRLPTRAHTGRPLLERSTASAFTGAHARKTGRATPPRAGLVTVGRSHERFPRADVRSPTSKPGCTGGRTRHEGRTNVRNAPHEEPAPTRARVFDRNSSSGSRVASCRHARSVESLGVERIAIDLRHPRPNRSTSCDFGLHTTRSSWDAPRPRASISIPRTSVCLLIDATSRRQLRRDGERERSPKSAFRVPDFELLS